MLPLYPSALLLGGIVAMTSPVAAQPSQGTEFTSVSSAPRTPISTDKTARKHVRGCPVDRTCRESLRDGLREFEVRTFPRKGQQSPWLDRPRSGAPGARARHSRATSRPSALALRPDLPWLAKLRLPNLPVHWDLRTIKYLEFYKNDRRGRNIMGAWLRDQGKYRDMLLAHLRAAKLPTDLLYVSMIESSYDPLEYSRAGAAGLWQFMSHGGRVYGLTINRWVDERYDPIRSTEAVVYYWADLYQRFGNWDLALTAFNAGYAGVLRSIAKYNTNDFWQLVDLENALPWGSTIYVPKSIAAAIVGHNRELFGYDEIKEAAPVEWDDVAVTRSVSLRTIARAAGTNVDTLKKLNPQLRRGRTPPGMKRYLVHIPRGSAALFRARFPRMSAELERLEEYRVRHGERFEDIATVHGISRSKLRRLNGVEHESEIGGGMTLLVPRVSDEQKRKNHRRAMDKLYAGGHPAGKPGDALVVAVPDAAAIPRGRRRVFYRVVTGDSQTKIARAFEVDRRDLARWNGLDAEGFLHPRMVLQLFVRKNFDPRKRGIALLDPRRLTVVTRGSAAHIAASEAKLGRRRVVYHPTRPESYAAIGARFGLSDRDLARINRKRRKTVAQPGEGVVVYQVVNRRASKRAAEQAAKLRKHKAQARKGRRDAAHKASARAPAAKKRAPAAKKRAPAAKKKALERARKTKTPITAQR